MASPNMVDSPLFTQFPEILVKTNRKSGGIAGAERSSFFDQGPNDVAVEDVRLKLHEQLVFNHTAVSAQRIQFLSGVQFHGFEYFARLISRGFQNRAR